ncbi:30S ribosomal protein S16 [Candidatus Woesebacteria bacterium]|nr:30S ribosomal protein S16 [Candidatus Woesebacteria bacterium]
MLKIRLSRLGKKKNPFYRVVVIDEKKKVTGKPAATLGTWYPSKNKKNIDNKQLLDWVNKGAKVSPAVKELLKP